MTRICYRCSVAPCIWDDGKDKITTSPKPLDISNPSCPDDAPMPNEFKDSYKG
jgi:hypothetical protein